MSATAPRLIAFALILVAVVSSAATGVGPKLVCEQPIRDFGVVGNVGTLSHTFVLRNDGDEPLKILNVATCSSCTNPELSRTEIPPGETAELATEASVYGKSGKVSLEVRIRTNDPARRNLTLELRAVVETWVSINPLRVSFQRTADDEAASRHVSVRATDKVEPFDITALETDVDWLEAESRTLDDGRHRITVRTVPPLPRGWHEANLRVRTDSEKIGSFDITIRALIIGELMVWPEKISLLDSDADSRVRRHVDVLPGKVDKVEIVSVQPPVAMDVEIEPTGMDGKGRRIWLKDIPVSSDLDGRELVIKTDADEMETIRVPFEVSKGKPCPTCP
ncbi:MAG: DUF1573 domain-containing protein [Phycisphaerae bacterium]